jgi:hypothetical protein
MKKIFLFVFFAFISNASAITGFTYKYIWKAGDTVTALKFKTNEDSSKNWSSRTADTINKVSDTLNKVVPRWSLMLYQKDSTWKYMTIDTVKILHGDSIYSRTIRSDSLKIVSLGNPTIRIKKNGEKRSLLLGKYYIFSDSEDIYLGCTRDSNSIRFQLGNKLPMSIDTGAIRIGRPLYDTGMVACNNVLTNYTQYGTGNASKDSVYIDTSFSDSADHLYGFLMSGTGQVIATGHKITYQVDSLAGDCAPPGTFLIRGLPTKFRPAKNMYWTTSIRFDGTYIIGIIKWDIVQNKFYVQTPAGQDIYGQCAIRKTTISWIK